MRDRYDEKIVVDIVVGVQQNFRDYCHDGSLNVKNKSIGWKTCIFIQPDDQLMIDGNTALNVEYDLLETVRHSKFNKGIRKEQQTTLCPPQSFLEDSFMICISGLNWGSHLRLRKSCWSRKSIILQP